MHGALLPVAVHIGRHELHAHHFHGPHIDYVGVGIGAALSWLVLTGPGEAALITAGIAASRGRLDIGGVVAVAWLGAFAGGAAGWLLGIKGGRALMSAPGPLYRLRLRMLEHGDRVYARQGPLAVYFAPAWMAGINGMHGRRFLPINAGAALVWALLVGLGAYFAGPSVTDLLADVGAAGIGLLALVVALTVGGEALRRRRRRRRRRKRSISQHD